jgi:enamine deaminase RidA (YjgF/YER057c/UK114 family)
MTKGEMSQKRFLNPPQLPSWETFFTNVVTVEKNGTETIYLAGQLGIDQNKNFVGAGDLADQTAQAFKNVAIALASVDASPADIVKLVIYVVDYKPSDAATIGAVIAEFFPDQKPPACTLLGVQSLAEERFLIEVEAIAVR